MCRPAEEAAVTLMTGMRERLKENGHLGLHKIMSNSHKVLQSPQEEDFGKKMSKR